MAHGITDADTMFSVRKMPWHGLGAVLDDHPESIDDALEKSGLNWQVVQRPVFVPDSEPTTNEDGDFSWAPSYAQIPDTVANVREDNDTVLGIVGEGYEVVQNKQAFEFLDAVLGTDLMFETAGSLHGGKRVWVLARRPEFVKVAGDDTATYVFIASSHDGTMSVTSAVTPTRIVCANTLGIALHRADGAPRTFRMRHTVGIEHKWEEAREVMQLTVNYEERFQAIGNEMGRQAMNTDQLVKVLDKLFPQDDEMGDRAKQNRTDATEQIVALFKGGGADGDTSGNSPDTKWAAWNAVGEWSDWYRRRTKNTDQVHRSFEDNRIKQAAFDLITAA